jgi:hypothetical protein
MADYGMRPNASNILSLSKGDHGICHGVHAMACAMAYADIVVIVVISCRLPLSPSPVSLLCPLPHQKCKKTYEKSAQMQDKHTTSTYNPRKTA